MVLTWLLRHPRLTDWALALFALVTVGGAAVHHGRSSVELPFALLASLPLLVRRSHPFAVLAVTTAATIALVAGWDLYNPFPAGVALYTVAERSDRRTSLVAGGVAVAALAVTFGPVVGWEHGFLIIGRLLPFALAWLIGDSVGSRRKYVAALEERADRLERERETEAARAVAEEQARIGRELHDVIAHNLSVMVVQAAAADDVFDRRPERARKALRDIERTGRAALDELRQLLGSVHGEEASFAPQPGLALLDELAGTVRAAGLDVTVSRQGSPRPLPPAIDLSAYRVVQEALTNTLKHARASHAEVVLRYLDDELDLEIHDDGIGEGAAPGNGTGHGLIGMRERLGLFGGTLAAGPAKGGGYVVSARFPLAAS
jgi:signal transduction histidine kinase